MDWSNVWWGIGRDLHELLTNGPIGWVILLGFAGLLVGALLALVVWRRRGAWLALLLGLVPFVLGVLHYGADLWSNQGTQGIVYVVLPVLAGWVVLATVWTCDPASKRRPLGWRHESARRPAHKDRDLRVGGAQRRR
nr:hypothetical protein [Actinomycetales bacterium]